MKQHTRKDGRARRLGALERMERQVVELSEALARAENNKSDVATVFVRRPWGTVPQMWLVGDVKREIDRITVVMNNTADNLRPRF